MSRTYRRCMLQLDCNCGAPVEESFCYNSKRGIFYSSDKNLRWSRSRQVPPDKTCECGVKYDYYSKRNWKRDRKNTWKPPKWYKVMKKRERKAKEKDALRSHQYDSIPHFRKSDLRDWD